MTQKQRLREHCPSSKLLTEKALPVYAALPSKGAQGGQAFTLRVVAAVWIYTEEKADAILARGHFAPAGLLLHLPHLLDDFLVALLHL